jgi:hypothetical protein
LPIYRLSPRDATDRVWCGFAFVETVWTEAGCERAARTRVSAFALKMMGDDPNSALPMRNWPWIYSSICTLDESHPFIATGQVVAADGRAIGVQADDAEGLGRLATCSKTAGAFASRPSDEGLMASIVKAQ